jgi:hypothetical protein
MANGSDCLTVLAARPTDGRAEQVWRRARLRRARVSPDAEQRGPRSFGRSPQGWLPARTPNEDGAVSRRQYSGSSSIPKPHRPVRSAAVRVVPEPQNGSSAMPLRREQSRIASSTRATGLTVGCSSRSERALPKPLTPAYSHNLTPQSRLRAPERMSASTSGVRKIAAIPIERLTRLAIIPNRQACRNRMWPSDLGA